MGLIEYVTNFYTAEDINEVGYVLCVTNLKVMHVQCTLYVDMQVMYIASLQVPSCPEDCRAWLQTMYSHFGQKWTRLHHGPMWSLASSYHLSHQHERCTMKV